MKSQTYCLSYLASGAVHVIVLTAVHSIISSTSPNAWESRTGVSSNASLGAIEIMIAADMQPDRAQTADVELKLIDESELLESESRHVGDEMAAGEVLHFSRSHLNSDHLIIPRMQSTPRTIPSDAVEFATSGQLINVTSRPTEQILSATRRNGLWKSLQSVPDAHSLRLPDRSTKRDVQPPTTSSVATLESVFSAGQLHKSIPRPSYNPAPAYPPELLKARESGIVVLRVEVSAEGRVLRCSVQETSGHAAFDTAAVKTVETWRFDPAVRFGIPVATTVLCPIRFQFLDG